MTASTAFTSLTWLGIVLCMSQSAFFSGLNLAVFGVSRLRLEVEASTGSVAARQVLALRQDSNFLLTTILWGNVSINVLLTLLADSILAGVAAFLFSTVVITLAGEILPQAYFSRHALQMTARLAPLLRIYQIVLFVVAKPTALLLDLWLGREGVQYLREHEFHELIRKHVEAEESDVDRVEGLGALNFLALDDVMAGGEGEPLDPLSVIHLPVQEGRPVFPSFDPSPEDPFLRTLHASGRKWVVVLDDQERPRFVIDADGLLRDALFDKGHLTPHLPCHRPVVIREAHIPLGRVLLRLNTRPRSPEDDVIHHDVILVWGDERRVITGADLLGRLLRGIARPGLPRSV
jgi:metal transporter CNNM